ncbi:MAG: extracellular solute-binding protein [Clostridia bacterium]|nr:extracellular solute-binding protein [Clostridia bacterium]
MAKRMLSLLLVALMCLSAALIVSCGDKDNESSAVPAASGTVSEDDENTLKLPDKNWGGQKVTLMTFKNGKRNFSDTVIPEEYNNEPINDAFFDRNALIEEKYGIKLELIPCDGVDEGIEMLRQDMDGGMQEINIVSLPITYMAQFGIEGSLYDYKTLYAKNGYIHYDSPWWDQAMVRDLDINDQLWFLAGDALVEDDEATWAIYFNKDLVESYQLESPYEVVKEHKWTLDKMHEMAKQVHHMNGSQMSYEPEDNDVWGIVTQSYDCYAFMLCGGQAMVDNSGDLPVFRVMEEENVSTFDSVMAIMSDEENVGVADFFGAWNSGVYDKETSIFCNGNALFMPQTISQVSGAKMRSAEIHYGILPMPLRSELQDDYSTSVSVYWAQVLCIPISNVDNLDATCYAMELMAYYGLQKVTPEYYSRTLKYKRFEDEESGEMLDYVFRNRTYDLAGIFDFGTVNGNGAGSLYFYTTLLFQKSNYKLASMWESKESLFNGALDELIAQVRGIDG